MDRPDQFRSSTVRSDSQPLLEVRGISCNYELERVVFDLSLRVHRGEQVCLLGPSGCGKTTVLRAIAGFHPILTGGIFINDQQVSAVGAMVPPESRRVGMVFQDHALFPHLTVRQNVAAGLSQLPEGSRGESVGEMLERMGLSHHADRFPHELSGGQQQRVAIARAIINQPALLLADEPTGALDSRTTDDVLNLFDSLHRQGITVVLVTHEDDVAARAERVAHFRDGQVERWEIPEPTTGPGHHP